MAYGVKVYGHCFSVCDFRFGGFRVLRCMVWVFCSRVHGRIVDGFMVFRAYVLCFKAFGFRVSGVYGLQVCQLARLPACLLDCLLASLPACLPRCLLACLLRNRTTKK